MIISVIYSPLKDTFEFLEGIHRYQPYTKFFEVLDDFFINEDYDLNKTAIIETIFSGNVLNSSVIKSIGLDVKDKQFKRQL